MTKSFQITEYCHDLIENYAEGADLCIDATVGNGGDTLFLCRMAGPEGRVIGFDIQPEAIEATGRILEAEGVSERAELHLESHEKMAEFCDCEADIIVFNFGYLPGGDHEIATRAETSVKAVSAGLDLLKKGGIMSLCIYSGGDSGFEERDALLEFLRGVDRKKFVVITHEFFNRPNDPPLPVLIKRLR